MKEQVIVEGKVYEINIQASCYNLRKDGYTWRVVADKLGIGSSGNSYRNAVSYAGRYGLGMPQIYNKPGRKKTTGVSQYKGKSLKEQCAIRKAERV